MIRLHSLCYVVGLTGDFEQFNGHVVEVIGPLVMRPVLGGGYLRGYLCDALWLREAFHRRVPHVEYKGASVESCYLLPICEPPIAYKQSRSVGAHK